MMKAAGYDPSTRVWDIRLGSPELLVSASRRHMIQRRDQLMAND
jgi:hypothetical protein